MANHERGEMALIAAGTTYTLRLTVDSVCVLEHETGLELAAITTRVAKGRAKELRALLWASLQALHGDTVRTLDQSGAIMDAVGGAHVIRPLLAAFLKLNADDDPVSPENSARSKHHTKPGPGSQWRELYIQARRFEVSREDFWSMSLRELWREMAAHRQRQRNDLELAIVTAWWVACLVWQKKLPKLKTLLGVPTPRQTATEMRSMLQLLSRQYGFPLKTARPERRDQGRAGFTNSARRGRPTEPDTEGDER